MAALRTLALVSAVLIAAALIGTALLAVTGFIVGVRTRNERVLQFARRMQRDVVNPKTLQDAGTPGSPWAVLRVPGRTSGRIYDTPVGVQRAGDDLYISLVYGEGTQWLRNIRAAGGATVLHDGQEIEATDPTLVPITDTPITSSDRVAAAVFGTTHALRLRAVASVRLPQDLSRPSPTK